MTDPRGADTMIRFRPATPTNGRRTEACPADRAINRHVTAVDEIAGQPIGFLDVGTAL
jgi:hypothetical protein